MTNNVIYLSGLTTNRVDVERVVELGKEECGESAIVVGLDKNGEFYLALSNPDAIEAVYLLERAKHMILSQGE